MTDPIPPDSEATAAATPTSEIDHDAPPAAPSNSRKGKGKRKPPVVEDTAAESSEEVPKTMDPPRRSGRSRAGK